jgi:hypothetical protein
MNLDEKYRAWKERPCPMDVSADFSADVMRRIRRQAEQRQRVRQNWFGFLEFLPRSVRFAVLAVAAMIGLGRFWLLFSIIFKPELMNFK